MSLIESRISINSLDILDSLVPTLSEELIWSEGIPDHRPLVEVVRSLKMMSCVRVSLKEVFKLQYIVDWQYRVTAVQCSSVFIKRELE